MKKLLFSFVACNLVLMAAAQQNLQSANQTSSTAVAESVANNTTGETTLKATDQLTSLKGKLVVRGTNKNIAGATILLVNQNVSTLTNANGEFSLIYLESGTEEILIEADGYISTVELVNIRQGENNDLGTLLLSQDMQADVNNDILITIDDEDLNDDEGKQQSQGASFSSSQDVFNSTTSFEWSNARYRNRGYNSTYEQTYINGLSFNSAERGQFNFSAMGGVNEASRYKETVNAIEANNFTFGSLGNSTNYLMNASRYAEGWRIGAAGTNRNYKAMVRAAYASGILSNGWAFMGQLAYRFTPYIDQKGIIGEGVRYNSIGAYFGAEKIWDNGNRLNLIAFASPTERGQSGALTQEAIDLTGSIYYNPYWGYQNGHIRNSRIVHSIDPTVIATYDLKVNENHSLKFGLGYHYSMYSNSALQFFNAPSPAPDYYRNMPSFLWDGQLAYASSDQLYHTLGAGADAKHFPYGSFIGADMNGYTMGSGFIANDGNLIGPSIDSNLYNNLVDLWKSRDNTTTQIDWDALYMANIANNYVNPTGSARYIQERRHNDIQEGVANIRYINTAVQHMTLTVGVDAKVSQGIHFKTIDDMLGGNQWIDIDPFADRDIKDLATNVGLTQSEIENVRKNDISNNYNDVKHKGDRFGYDYRMNIYTTRLWAQNEWSFNEIDFYYGLQMTYSGMQRTTNMVNGRAWYLAQINPSEMQKYLGPDALTILTSYAEGTLTAGTTWLGETHNFIDPAFKLGATYKINGRNKLKLNALAQTTAPLARDAYVSSRIHDRVVDNIYTHDNAKNLGDYFAASEKSVGGDLTYEFNYPIVRGRLTGFYTQFWNGTEMNGYYDDEARTFVNQTLTGIDRRHLGVEAAISVKLGTYFTLTGVTSVGDYRYTSNALAVTSAENGMAIGTDRDGRSIFEATDSVYMNGLHVATGPQVNASLKLSFFHPKMWFADITVSYYDWNYLNIAPARRMMGLYKEQRADKTLVNGGFYDAIPSNVMGAILVDENGEMLTDKYGTPQLMYPYNLMVDQESITATNVWNRFLINASVGKLIYLPNRQQLSINLSVSNLTNNTHFKTGGYQQSRLPRQNLQGQMVSETPEAKAFSKSIISANAWKFPSRYYYAWGTNFYLSITYKF